MKKRAVIKELAHNRVFWRGELSLGVWAEMEFFAPHGGGAVRRDDGANNPQVCEGLFSTGRALVWDGSDPLVKLIRRENRTHTRRLGKYGMLQR